MVSKHLDEITDMLFKDDNFNPHPDSDHFDFWLKKKMVAFTEQDWKIMRFAYKRGVAEGLIKA